MTLNKAEPELDLQDTDTKEDALRRVLRKVEIGETAAVIVLQSTGRIFIWYEEATDAQDAKWYQDMLGGIADKLGVK